MELVRTKEVMTAGITNIPLTLPAYIFFNADNKETYRACQEVFDIMRLPYESHYVKATENYHIRTIDKIPPSIMRQIWRNFKTLHPKYDTEYRYLFWELDSRKQEYLDAVINVYSYLNLPVYVHKSAKGYHFLSVKPISRDVMVWAIEGINYNIFNMRGIRYTNDTYPPITLRIKPNKYVGEEIEFHEGFIMSSAYHRDTHDLQKLIVAQDFIKLGEKYQLVWYSLDKKVTQKETPL